MRRFAPVLIAVCMAAGCPAPDAKHLAAGLSAATLPQPPAKPEAAPTPQPVAQPQSCAAVAPLDVLFVGNSYMIQSDAPGFFQAMAEDAGAQFHVERLAKGGKDFAYHQGRKQTEQVLASRSWDVVVLQSHSLDPLRNPEGFVSAGKALITAVRAHGAEPWLFETWPRRKGHNLYNYMDEVGKTPREMLARVRARYAALGEDTGVPVARVGSAWMQLQEQHPELRPYLKDGAHPAEAGAYLSAAVVFTHLTERDPRGVLAPHGSVDEAEASVLLEVAADVVRPPCHW